MILIVSKQKKPWHFSLLLMFIWRSDQENNANLSVNYVWMVMNPLQAPQDWSLRSVVSLCHSAPSFTSSRLCGPPLLTKQPMCLRDGGQWNRTMFSFRHTGCCGTIELNAPCIAATASAPLRFNLQMTPRGWTICWCVMKWSSFNKLQFSSRISTITIKGFFFSKGRVKLW